MKKIFVFILILLLPQMVLAEAKRPEDNSSLVVLTLEQESMAADLNSALKCPVCKNQALAASSSFIAEEMKREIRRMVKRGLSKQEILDFYEERYTDWVLLKPPVKGMNWFLYILPLGSFILAVGGVTWWLRGQKEETAYFAAVEEQQNKTGIDDDAMAKAKKLVEKELSL